MCLRFKNSYTVQRQKIVDTGRHFRI